jgi:hypothetical protein
MESVLIHTNPSGKELRILTATSDKWTVSRDFFFWFFHESVSPQPQSIPLRLFQGAPPVSTTPEVHLELQISPRIFEKTETALLVYSGAWGKLIHVKNQKSKIS